MNGVSHFMYGRKYIVLFLIPSSFFSIRYINNTIHNTVTQNKCSIKFIFNDQTSLNNANFLIVIFKTCILNY